MGVHTRSGRVAFNFLACLSKFRFFPSRMSVKTGQVYTENCVWHTLLFVELTLSSCNRKLSEALLEQGRRITEVHEELEFIVFLVLNEQYICTSSISAKGHVSIDVVVIFAKIIAALQSV